CPASHIVLGKGLATCRCDCTSPRSSLINRVKEYRRRTQTRRVSRPAPKNASHTFDARADGNVHITLVTSTRKNQKPEQVSRTHADTGLRITYLQLLKVDGDTCLCRCAAERNRERYSPRASAGRNHEVHLQDAGNISGRLAVCSDCRRLVSDPNGGHHKRH